MTLTQPKILVLGATGQVGGETVRLLAQSSDIQVIAGVRSPEKAEHLFERNVKIRHLDLARHDTLIPALEEIDRALLLSGYSVDMLKQSKAFLDIAFASRRSTHRSSWRIGRTHQRSCSLGLASIHRTLY